MSVSFLRFCPESGLTGHDNIADTHRVLYSEQIKHSAAWTKILHWLRKYHAGLLAKIYQGSLYGGADKLDSLWPIFVGGAIFAALDIGLVLSHPFRSILLTVLIGPGVLWAAYILFHEMRSLPKRFRRHKSTLDSERKSDR